MIDLTDNSYTPSHTILSQDDDLGPLHLGDINAALNIQALTSHNIKTVITAANNMDHVQYPPNTIKHIIYPLMDVKSEKISKYFNEVYRVIEEARMRGGVLVHCAAGVSRSATLVIAYLMRKESWSFKKAIEFVRAKRRIVCPNLGFELQLKEYEKQCCLKNLPSKQSILRIYDSLRKFNGNTGEIEFNPLVNKEKRILKHRKMSQAGRRVAVKNPLAEEKLNLINNFIIVPLKLHKEENNRSRQGEKEREKERERETNEGREFRVKPKTSSYPVRNRLG